MRLPGIACLLLAATMPGASFAEPPAALVPSAVNPAVNQANIHQTICVPGWTRTVRPPVSYTNALKIRQMAQFGLKGSPHDYEEDHLISLEVGGNPRSPANLWPEPWTGPHNARDKDRLENAVHRLVCSGRIRLSEGQRELSTDWVAFYRLRIGALGPAPARLLPSRESPAERRTTGIYRTCAEARAAGAAPIHAGQPGYSGRLDRDGDGFACESYRRR